MQNKVTYLSRNNPWIIQNLWAEKLVYIWPLGIFIMQKSWEKGVGMYNVTRHGVKIDKADLHVNYLRVSIYLYPTFLYPTTN